MEELSPGNIYILEVKCDDDRYAAIIRRKAGEVPGGNRFGTG
jgi:hypothetical protein